VTRKPFQFGDTSTTNQSVSKNQKPLRECVALLLPCTYNSYKFGAQNRCTFNYFQLNSRSKNLFSRTVIAKIYFLTNTHLSYYFGSQYLPHWLKKKLNYMQKKFPTRALKNFQWKFY